MAGQKMTVNNDDDSVPFPIIMLPRIDWSRRFPSFSQRKYNVTPRSSIFPPDPTDRPFIMKTSARDKLPSSKGKSREPHTSQPSVVHKSTSSDPRIGSVTRRRGISLSPVKNVGTGRLERPRSRPGKEQQSSAASILLIAVAPTDPRLSRTLNAFFSLHQDRRPSCPTSGRVTVYISPIPSLSWMPIHPAEWLRSRADPPLPPRRHGMSSARGCQGVGHRYDAAMATPSVACTIPPWPLTQVATDAGGPTVPTGQDAWTAEMPRTSCVYKWSSVRVLVRREPMARQAGRTGVHICSRPGLCADYGLIPASQANVSGLRLVSPKAGCKADEPTLGVAGLGSRVQRRVLPVVSPVVPCGWDMSNIRIESSPTRRPGVENSVCGTSLSGGGLCCAPGLPREELLRIFPVCCGEDGQKYEQCGGTRSPGSAGFRGRAVRV
ncbi:hypothetical protein Bbelb_407990 [Branchiostoma belcheri]|nr:hypothetical protein Bbelb_407990 [Branchiostoma belcheri]